MSVDATPHSVEQVRRLLEGRDYIAGGRLSTAVYSWRSASGGRCSWRARPA